MTAAAPVWHIPDDARLVAVETAVDGDRQIACLVYVLDGREIETPWAELRPLPVIAAD